MPSDGVERIVELTCFNCSEQWEVELEKGDKVGRRRDIKEARGIDPDIVVVRNTPSSTMRTENCPVCMLKGPHKIESTNNPA